MRIIPTAIVIAVISVAGCTGSAEETFFPVMPEALAGCRIFYLSSYREAMTVMRCPNSTTTTKTQAGKAFKTTVVIDDAKADSGDDGMTKIVPKTIGLVSYLHGDDPSTTAGTATISDGLVNFLFDCKNDHEAWRIGTMVEQAYFNGLRKGRSEVMEAASNAWIGLRTPTV